MECRLASVLTMYFHTKAKDILGVFLITMQRELSLCIVGACVDTVKIERK
jgi:hypothetical protein